MRTLYLVRHGHTIWHETAGVAGSSDIALSEAGQEAVRRLASSFSPEFAVERWFCSPMQRTQDTSAILRANMARRSSSSPLPNVQCDDRLVELNFGDWEGMTWPEVHERYEKQMNQWGQDWINRSPPNGETFAQQVKRCDDWLESIADTRSAMVVTHGGSIRALMCLCLEWPLTRAMSFRVDPASQCVLQQDEPLQPWRVAMINSQHA